VRAPRLSTALGGAFVVWGVAIGLLRLHDNSYLTAVATGRIILAHGVPTHDPYSFTAHGSPWVVESWLASLLYAVTERLWGAHGLQLEHAVLTGVLAALVWVLTRPARALGGRILAAAAVLAVGTGYWSPRPMLIALVLFAVVMVMAETERGSPWLLVPVMWVWVNVHGSWPFAAVYLLVRIAGRAIERRPLGRLPRLTGAVVIGSLLGAANPIGLRLLEYPVTVLTHHQAFAHIVEWQSPSFSDPVNAVFLAEVLLALVLLVARRGSVEDGLTTVVFAAAGFLASRNVPVAAIVVAPVLARGLVDLGSLHGTRRGVLPAAALAALSALGAVFVAGALEHPAFDLAAYPVSEVTWMQKHSLIPGRVVAPDYVGNYLEYRLGTRASVFIDDRVDMFPLSVVDSSATLLGGSEGWQGVLDHVRASAVLWPRSEPLAGLVAEDRSWRVVLRDRHWLVAVPVRDPVRVPVRDPVPVHAS
jgi:hypothetical protein